ncbi:hypothetical protein [Actinomadura rugatobispora]|uniref:Secreted protein n=1 Tax=Actinomadura rugatobispora TaxID=1994 RepID=A0ABW1A273_9ACTN
MNAGHGNGRPGNGRGAGAVRRAALPAAVLAVVTALPAAAVAAHTPAAEEDEPTSLACPEGVGDEDELAQAFRTGGTILLESRCTYTLTRRHGKVSALPPIENDTVIDGGGSTIAWGGSERVGSLLEIAGSQIRLELRDVHFRPGAGMTLMRVRSGSSVSVSQTGGGRDLANLREGDNAKGTVRDKFEDAGKLASWLLPALGEAPAMLGEAVREELAERSDR